AWIELDGRLADILERAAHVVAKGRTDRHEVVVAGHRTAVGAGFLRDHHVEWDQLPDLDLARSNAAGQRGDAVADSGRPARQDQNVVSAVALVSEEVEGRIVPRPGADKNEVVLLADRYDPLHRTAWGILASDVTLALKLRHG